ncbi:hypothetical protein [Agaribacterium sp. ZY112]|uniref:hypothetical protein n=1 Tax=Agaribacterium sp. ZY112 TaxID=3233574 RepID=UPI003524892A
MSPAKQAALYSALIYPGAGLWHLRRHTFALVFIVPATLALIIVLIGVWQIANVVADQAVQEILQSGKFNINIADIMQSIREGISTKPELVKAKWVLLIIWLISIITSYMYGLKSDRK